MEPNIRREYILKNMCQNPPCMNMCVNICHGLKNGDAG